MMHGPGCPVCVLPIGRIDQAIALARKPNVILCDVRGHDAGARARTGSA
jgi:hydrogenase expression/formation protein HypD